MDENVKKAGESKYELLLAKVKKATGIDTISLTIDAAQIIVDDYSVPKCLLHIGTMYGAMQIVTGYPSDCNMSEQDLIDFNILEPLPDELVGKCNLVPIGIPGMFLYDGKRHV